VTPRSARYEAVLQTVVAARAVATRGKVIAAMAVTFASAHVARLRAR
jgi:uncharacterized membrane protein